MSTDAHFHTMVGEMPLSMQIIREADFPEALVLNDSVEKFKHFLAEGRKKGAEKACR
jgi:putative hydrolase